MRNNIDENPEGKGRENMYLYNSSLLTGALYLYSCILNNYDIMFIFYK